jgi:hypothetical protein
MKTPLALLLFWGSLAAAQTSLGNICIVDGIKNVGLAGINACNSSFSNSSPGLTWIPSNAPSAGRWATPPNGTMLIDTRFANGPGFNEGGMHGQKAHIVFDCHAGANDAYESSGSFTGPVCLEFDAFADSGGTDGNNTRQNLVGIMGYATRSINSARPVWGANFGVTYNVTNSTNMATALELDIGAVDADDPIQQGVGLRILNGGPHKVGGGFVVDGERSKFVRGGTIQNYTEIGLEMTPNARRTADIQIIPPADDNAPSVILRDAANKATVLAINDSGDLATTGSIRGKNVPIVTSFITTSATTDFVAVTGMTPSGHCSLTATNAEAARGSPSVWVSNKTTNRISVTHAPSPGWTFDVMCTPN